MMLDREVCELKIDELVSIHKQLVSDLDNGRCSPDYFKLNSAKIMGQIQGIAFCLGYNVENKMKERL